MSGRPTPIRLIRLVTLALALAAPLLAAQPEPVVVLLEQGRREVLPVRRDGEELLPLAPVIAGLGVELSSDAVGGTATLSYQSRQVTVYRGKSLASVGGDLRLLSGPARLERGEWLVPVDGLPRILEPLLGRPVSWRPIARVLLVGNVDLPRVRVLVAAGSERVRVEFQGSRGIAFQAFQESGRVTVKIAAAALDVQEEPTEVSGGIVESVRFLGGRDNVFAVKLGPRFRELKAYQRPNRLVLEIEGSPGAAPPVDRVVAAPAAPRPEPPATPIVVIDPGHGGDEVGAQGPGGTAEKDVTLAIAQRLQAALSSEMGYEVFLTRAGDQELPLDERAAIANNYKADAFVSIHANASRSHGASGSEVYFLSDQASDDAARLVALAEGGALPDDVAAGGSDLAFILWDMAQTEHLEESSVLASRLLEELAIVTGSERRGIKQAPFRVLVGAAMPAVLVEVAFISNRDEEQLLVSDQYQNQVAEALARGISRFLHDRLGRSGADPSRAAQP